MRYLNEFKKQFTHIKIEIRIHKDNTLHDRFIVVKSSNIAYSIGTSLNGLGKKDCLIIELPKEVIHALIDLFEYRWKEAKKIIEIHNKGDNLLVKNINQSYI